MKITFTTFILSLSTAALQHLGVATPGDEAEQPEVSLPAAQQTIDILEVLAEKTKGNLSEEEDKLLGTLLYDLRMRYVEVARGAAS